MSTKYLTKAEAADYLRVSESTLDRWVRERRVRRYKIDGIQSARFVRAELDAVVVLDEEADHDRETVVRS